MAMKRRWSLSDDLRRLEKEDPAVAAAVVRYERMNGRIRGYGLPPSELAALYDVSVPLPVETELESVVLEENPDGKSFHGPTPARPPADESPGHS
jgi:hypothetical protein